MSTVLRFCHSCDKIPKRLTDCASAFIRRYQVSHHWIMHFFMSTVLRFCHSCDKIPKRLTDCASAFIRLVDINTLYPVLLQMRVLSQNDLDDLLKFCSSRPRNVNILHLLSVLDKKRRKRCPLCYRRTNYKALVCTCGNSTGSLLLPPSFI